MTLLVQLRRDFFKAEFRRGNTLIYANHQWGRFVRFLRFGHREIGFPLIEWADVAALPKNLVDIDRASAIGRAVDDRMVPRSMDVAADSYHSDLLVPVSFSISSDDYLDEYTRKLKHALDSFHAAALTEFEELCAKELEGSKLIKSTDYTRLSSRFRIVNGKGSKDPWKFRDEKTKVHVLRESASHPNLLGNLLSIVHHEMGGIPKPYAAQTGSRIVHAVGMGHWRYVEAYGKNRLLPYLGVLSATAAIPLFILLLLEMPRLNVSSLARAKLENAEGTSLLLSSAGEGPDAIRITVDKGRACCQKHALLTPLSQRVIDALLRWTKPIREELKAQGRRDEAQWLWIGISRVDYKLLVITERMQLQSMRPDSDKRRQLATNKDAKVIPFLLRHQTLEPWRAHATLKALRVSKGVLVFLESDGDLVAAARAFGHANVRTTLDRYVPKQLQEALFERQIRRHQNLLPILALENQDDRLNISDFSSYEDLHEFLYSIVKQFHTALNFKHPSEIPGLLRKAIVPTTSSAQEHGEDAHPLLMLDDIHSLAVAILYRNHLNNCSTEFLATPDAKTGVAPIMWKEMMDSLSGKLPPAHFELSSVMTRARARADAIKSKVHFPELR